MRRPFPNRCTPSRDLIHQGKVRHFGVSNFRSWRVAEICRLCDDTGIDRPVVSQPYYNAMNRMPETEHLPACGFYGLGVVPYSPLARGVLTGKYLPDAEPLEGSRAARRDQRMMQSEWRTESLRFAQEIKKHAQARGIGAGEFAVAWLLNNRLVTSVIAGPRTEEQWEDYPKALDYRFTPEDEALIDRLVVTGHPSTPGYNDPAYPIEGRLARRGDREGLIRPTARVFRAAALSQISAGRRGLSAQDPRAVPPPPSAWRSRAPKPRARRGVRGRAPHFGPWP